MNIYMNIYIYIYIYTIIQYNILKRSRGCLGLIHLFIYSQDIFNIIFSL